MTVTGTDTICTVSIKTIRSYNHAFQDLEACNEIADTLYAQKERYKSLAKDQKEALKISEDINKAQKDQINQQQVLVDSYKKGESKNKIKSKFMKGFATGFGIISLIEAVYIGLQQLALKQ